MHIRITIGAAALAGILALAPASAAMSPEQAEKLANAASYRKDAAALTTLENAGKAGDAEALHALAEIYQYGSSGIPRDYAKALAWYRKAAEAGHAKGQYMLGKYYFEGDQVKKDYKQATLWLAKAAEQGLASAQYQLAELYYYDEYGQVDFDMAVSLYRKATLQGFSRAKLRLFNALSRQAIAEGREWKITDELLNAAQGGNAKAQFDLAAIYEDGYDGPQEFAKAVSWYRKSAEKGYARAQLGLAKLYYSGDGVPKLRVVTYALISLLAPKDRNMSAARDDLAQEMSKQEISAAQVLTQNLMKPGNFLAALDQYSANPTVREQPASPKS